MATARKKSSSKSTPAVSASPRTRGATSSTTPGRASGEVLPARRTRAAPGPKGSGAEADLEKKGTESPAVGTRAPAFALVDAQGAKVTSSSLKGTPYVLYFYPKDNTPGCTQEACDFRDNYSALKKLGVQVFGVSPDSAKSHLGFAEKHQLPFPLLVDDEKELAKAYGVWTMKKNYGREYLGIVRSTFLVDAAGKIAATWSGVRVAGHAAAVLLEAKKVSRS